MSFFDRIFRSRPPDPPAVPVARRVRELEIVTARLIRSGFAGEYHAAFHGKGIEFAQVREYEPGDDVRSIDWNVTARRGFPHVKQYVEERDMTLLIAIDVSSSMFFGSLDRRKIELATELTAVLSFAALQNRDRVGLVLFSNQIRRYLPAQRARNHIQMVVRQAVLSYELGGGKADFKALAQFVERIATKRAVIVVLSDFLDAEFEPSLRRLNRRHDVLALPLVDPREALFPSSGLVRLVDSESGVIRDVDLAANPLRAGASSREARLVERFRRIDIDSVTVSTGIPYERSLLQFFERRVARRR